jgi:hypothetical protein
LSFRAQARDLTKAALVTQATLRNPPAYVRSLIVYATRDDGPRAFATRLTQTATLQLQHFDYAKSSATAFS